MHGRRGYPRFVGSTSFPIGQQVQSDLENQQPPSNRFPLPASTRFQPDIAQDAHLRREIAQRGIQPFGLNDYNQHDDDRIPKATLINRSTAIVASGVPQRVLTQNRVRSDLEISNNTGAIILINYGQPAFPGSGLVLANNINFIRQGLACPDNEIWITGTIVGGVVTIYEGIPPYPRYRSRHK